MIYLELQVPQGKALHSKALPIPEIHIKATVCLLCFHGPHGPFFRSICLPEQLTGLKATDLFIIKES